MKCATTGIRCAPSISSTYNADDVREVRMEPRHFVSRRRPLEETGKLGHDVVVVSFCVGVQVPHLLPTGLRSAFVARNVVT